MERKLATVLFVDLVYSTELLADADPRSSGAASTASSTRSRIASSPTAARSRSSPAMPSWRPSAFRSLTRTMPSAPSALLRDPRARARARPRGADRDRVRRGRRRRQRLDVRDRRGREPRRAPAAGRPAPNEILVGPAAARLLRGRVELEPLDAARAARLARAGRRAARGLRRRAQRRRSGVSRRRSSAARPSWRCSRTRSRARPRDAARTLFTIYGDPGIGKSRLVREFVDGLEGATVLIGRCLPYGEGVTYWPLAEMVKASSGITDDDPLDKAQAKLRAYCEDEAVADLLGLAVGVLEAVEGERAQQEIAWAARAWAEQLADAQPLVLVFEDVHWGEEPLLELIEHLASWVREAPLMIVCLARRELLDVHPTWGGGRVLATTIELEPLQPEESAAARRGVDRRPRAADRPRGRARENRGQPPLPRGDGADARRAPARRRRADPRHAAGADRRAHRPAARSGARRPPARLRDGSDLHGAAPSRGSRRRSRTPDRRSTSSCSAISSCARPRATISGEQAYKFKHVLIREVAYSGLSKTARADLHHVFAEWLGERAGDELLEIRAFHLDQAARLLAELDGAAPAELREEAAEALTKAGTPRALARVVPKRAQAVAARRRAGADPRPAISRRPRGVAHGGLPGCPRRDGRGRGGTPSATGETQAAGPRADRARRGHAPAPRRRGDARGGSSARRSRCCRTRRPRSASSRCGSRRRSRRWLGDYAEFERWAKLALAAAREAERKDLEALVLHGLVTAYVIRLELAEAAPLLAARARARRRRAAASSAAPRR